MPLIDDLFSLPVPQSIQISPNSQQILYSTALTWNAKFPGAEHAVSTLWLAETGKADSARQLTAGNSNDRDPRWSPEGDSIAFLSDRGRTAERKESCAIYSLPASGPGEATAITDVANERNIESFRFSPMGGKIAFLSADEKDENRKKKDKEKDDVQVWGEELAFNRLRIVDLGTKAVEVLVSQEQHILEFAWNDDGSAIVFTTTKSTDIESNSLYGTDVWILDLETKKQKRICHIAKMGRDLVWAGKRIYWVGPVAEEWLTSAFGVHEVEVPADMSEAANEGTTNKSHHIAYAKTNCALNLSKTATGNEVLVYVQNGMADEIRLLNGDKTLFSKKRKILAWDATFTTDSDEVVLALAQGDSNNPTEVYTTTASGGSMVQLSHLGQTVKQAGRNFGTTTFLTCQSLDGKVQLECPLVLPFSAAPNNTKPAKPLPTVVLIHGGPYYRHTESFEGLYFMWAPLLLSAGYSILLADYRGSSGRGEEWASHARGNSGVKEDYEDIIGLTNAAVEQGYADPERLAVGGWSQGGFFSYLCSVRNGLHGLGWRFQAAIPGAGMTDLDTMALTSDVGFWEQELVASGAAWLSPPSDVRNRRGSALWEFRENVRSGKVVLPAMMILHGEGDVRVPVEQGRGMRRALEQFCAEEGKKEEGREGPVEWRYVVYPREGHFIVETGHLVDMGRRVVGWVERFLGKA
ncbi:hypothetical protein LTR78_006577 [Recurvomyces mirabilis]|uniref:Dipeptidyl-peptidase V n=1 Tax=Recurvomyces mirabilis TaxID=574656 RepID=A0AAE1C029_9PEZI|nr:hypothetical protein LTR78_006577 [Recurvomyces mirabilis]KAK5151006.1 hypothetical protein LTS14_009501 [Recurvomyces mirabilis]